MELVRAQFALTYLGTHYVDYLPVSAPAMNARYSDEKGIFPYPAAERASWAKRKEEDRTQLLLDTDSASYTQGESLPLQILTVTKGFPTRMSNVERSGHEAEMLSLLLHILRFDAIRSRHERVDVDLILSTICQLKDYLHIEHLLFNYSRLNEIADFDPLRQSTLG